MRERSFIFVAAFVAVLIVGSVVVYAYDASHDDQIADGVTVAGVDVGGMSTTQARKVVEREVARPLEQPVAVARGKQSFVLSARKARLRADAGGMVDDALEKSRRGNIVSRVARDVTGGEVDEDVAPRVSYSEQAVTRLVRRVKRTLDRKAQDATVNFPSLTQVKERDGVTVQAGELQRRVATALTAPAGNRSVRVPLRVTKAKVTQAQLAAKYPAVLVVDRTNFKLRFYRRLKLAKAYTVAVGQAGFDTPAGLYNIQNKGVNVPWNVPNKPWAGSLAGRIIPAGSPQNPIKARWMGIFDGAGIHGTDAVGSLGSRASHGCVRMAIPDVIELYPNVPVGAPVYIS